MTGTYRKNGCTIIVTAEGNVHAWVKEGSIAYYIRPTERDMFRFDPERALMFMIHRVNRGLFRCTNCGWESATRGEFSFFPMADLLCPACAADKAKALDEEYRSGNNCGFCKKPRSICTC